MGKSGRDMEKEGEEGRMEGKEKGKSERALRVHRLLQQDT